MKKEYPFLIILVLAALACAIPSAASFNLNKSVPNGFIRTPARAKSAPSELCAIVTAEKAQNVRLLEDASSRILFHLRHGDIVQVKDKSDSNWWLVTSSGGEGFARAKYLQIVECGAVYGQ